jgi:lipooligosaccharide transport system permease protein
MTGPPTTGVAAAPRAAAAPPWYALTCRAFAFWLLQYRRVWRGTAFSTVVQPVAFLAAMGLGLGALVDRGAGDAALPGGAYLHFLAPGLLAATAMQAATFESTYPVLGAIQWNRQYHAMLATPLRAVDVLAGHLLFVVFRISVTVTVFLAVMALFGAIRSPAALLCVPVGTLTGLAYAAPIFAFSAARASHTGFAMLFRFGIMPMFLFSGTFFPVDQLPDWLQPVAWAVPLWHGVELCRGLALGTAEPVAALVHVGYLALWAVGGFVLAARAFRRRLVR